MKHAFIAAAALSFCISTSAMAKDIDAIDLFVGDFAGVASANIDKLAANKMISDAAGNGISSVKDVEKLINELKAAGIDYKKDFAFMTFATTDKGKACIAVDAKKSVKEAYDAIVKKEGYKSADYNGMTIYSDDANSVVLLSDTRILACDNAIDMKPIIDNAKADKPKTLKSRDVAIYNAYSLTDSKADIRVAGKMTSYLKSQVASYKLDDGQGNVIAATDAESGAVSISFSKGLDVAVIAIAKNADVSKRGATIISTQLNAILSDPSLAELGLGFVKDAVKVANDKKNIKLTVKLSDDQLKTISMLLSELAGSSAKSTAPAAKK